LSQPIYCNIYIGVYRLRFGSAWKRRYGEKGEYAKKNFVELGMRSGGLGLAKKFHGILNIFDTL
jgi:hypothetical protein